jgi:fucose permease
MSVGEMFKYRNLWLCVLMCICMVPWMILAWVFLPQYYANVRHIPATEASYLMGVLGVSAATFSFLVPGLSDRLGRKPVMVVFSLIGVLVPLAVLYYPGSLVSLGTLIFLGWSASGVMPLLMGTVPSETIPVKYIATTLGIVMGLGELIGGAVTPTLAGMAADTYGLGATLLIEAGLALATAVLALFLIETAPVKVGHRATAAARQPA